jgi:hypothetical protein
MKLKNHLHLLYITTSFWTWFFIGGLWTNYYQDLCFTYKFLLGVIVPSFLLIIAANGILKSFTKSNYFRASFICASYFAFVLMFYDFIYLKLYLGKSMFYLIDYWYLTIFSPISFIVLMPIGYQMDK